VSGVDTGSGKRIALQKLIAGTDAGAMLLSAGIDCADLVIRLL
jgi:hypothetical protein